MTDLRIREPRGYFSSLWLLPIVVLLIALATPSNLFRCVQLLHDLRPHCNLTQICPWYAVRPTLPDGSPSSAVFDIPRHMLDYIPAHVVSFLSPTAFLVAHSHKPRILVFDSVLSVETQSQLLSRALNAFRVKQSNKDAPSPQQIVLSPHFDEDEVRNPSSSFTSYFPRDTPNSYFIYFCSDTFTIDL